MKRLLLILALLLSTIGCGTFLTDAMAALNEGTRYASTVGHWLNVAETGARVFFARHPSPNEAKVTAALHTARTALAAYDAVVEAGGDVKAAEAALREAYGALRELLSELGVLDASATGGPETEAPRPEPFELPPWDALRGS